MTDVQTTEPGTGLHPAAMVAAGVAAAALLSARSAQAQTAAFTPVTGLTYASIATVTGTTGDLQVLNYALALEDAEANLYAQALSRLTTGGTSDIGTVYAGLGLPATDVVVEYLTVFGKVEMQHRDFLRSALGYKADGSDDKVLFAYDFGLQNMDRTAVAALIYAVEATGVGAYLGAIPKLATATYAQIAAAIQGTEARHTAAMAIVRNIIGASPAIETAPLPAENHGIDTPIDPDTVLGGITGSPNQFLYKPATTAT